MATKRKSRSDISEAIHASAAMLHKIGARDEATMRDFDARRRNEPQQDRFLRSHPTLNVMDEPGEA